MPLDRQTVLDRVVDTIAEIAGLLPSQIQGSTEMIRDLALDSLSMYEIVIDLEEIFDLQIADSDLDRLVTVDDAVAFICTHGRD
jgi:acyl carrier protein